MSTVLINEINVINVTGKTTNYINDNEKLVTRLVGPT